MRRSPLLPLAGLALAGTLLAGCTAGGFPAPSPTATGSPTPSPTPEAVETAEPTVVPALPSSALLRLSVTAVAGDDEVRLVLTFDRAVPAVTLADEFEAVQEACPNAIASQLDLYPGTKPVGVITSELTTQGDWPAGFRFAVAAGGVIASIGDGADVEPADDPEAGFGCAVPIVSGPGTASFVSLLIGDPAVAPRVSLDDQVAHGLFGFESDGGSAASVTWKNCVVQLSAAAERFANDFGWVLPAEWGDGCLIGDGGSV